eukprot:TRINITY_DN10636_c0_g2_i1.p1 TRINITY_DN10636_c0_g2~~TRINITY_DN10636_c0_g2_i1.p1  ORF type:complete len:128 (+),score=1.65 TRINITY_DN10636_c0_g2_i1:611-994(+)
MGFQCQNLAKDFVSSSVLGNGRVLEFTYDKLKASSLEESSRVVESLSIDYNILSSSLAIALLIFLQAVVIFSWIELEVELIIDFLSISVIKSSICLTSFIAGNERDIGSSPRNAIMVRLEYSQRRLN